MRATVSTLSHPENLGARSKPCLTKNIYVSFVMDGTCAALDLVCAMSVLSAIFYILSQYRQGRGPKRTFFRTLSYLSLKLHMRSDVFFRCNVRQNIGGSSAIAQVDV